MNIVTSFMNDPLDIRQFDMRRSPRGKSHQLRDVGVSSSLRRKTAAADLSPHRMSTLGKSEQQDILHQRQFAKTN